MSEIDSRPSKRPLAPPAVRWIARTLEDAGFETWAVGGAVRDTFMGLPSGDWDLTTRARPEEVSKIFRKTIPIGVEHGTVGVLSRDGTLYEVTTFRRDVETFGRHAVVEFADTLDEDLDRRDFTINAVAWHPLRKELHDPHGGLKDIEAGVLRCVGDPVTRFAEDYLRVLRGLRFAGRFGLTIDPPTWTALEHVTDRLALLSAERVREEILKILQHDRAPSRSLELYRSSGALRDLLPEVAASYAGPTDPGRLSWEQALGVVDRLRSHRWLERLAVLLWPLGSPPTGQGEGRPDTPAPERGAIRSAALLSRLRFSNAEVRVVGEWVEGLLLPRPDWSNDVAVRRWLGRVGLERLRGLFRIWIAQARTGAQAHGSNEELTAWRAVRRVLSTRPPLTVADLALDGRDLIARGLKPGPSFGRLLDHLLDAVLENPARNDPDELWSRAETFMENDMNQTRSDE